LPSQSATGARNALILSSIVMAPVIAPQCSE
jgi:hypothetical protein